MNLQLHPNIMKYHSSLNFAILACWIALSFAVLTRAEDFYIAQTAQGTGNGNDATHAAAVGFFNASGNWSSPTKVAGKIGPGDTVHLVGLISTQIRVQASGSAADPITILFEPGARLSSPAWSFDGAISIYSQDYITIDGGTDGVIENTDNGTLLGNQVDSFGVKAQNSSFLTVNNLTVRNMYVRVAGSDNRAYGIGISNRASNYSFTDFTVMNSTIHNAVTGIGCDYGPGASNYEFSENTLYNCNWGIGCGDRHSGSTLSGLRVHHNTIYDWSNWNDTAGNAHHHNGFFAFANAGRLSDVSVYSNTFGPGYGNQYQTSGIYMNGYIERMSCYNNVFTCAANEYAANGLITLGTFLPTTINVYNNTFVTAGGGGAAIQLGGSGVGAAQTVNVVNNLGHAGGRATFIALYNRVGVSLHADYNLAYNYNPGLAYIYSTSGTGVFKTFDEWRALGFDEHGLIADPNLDGNLAPTDGSPAVDAGRDLSSLFTTDKAGRVRTGLWDIGAYEFMTSGSAPRPPTGLRTVIDSE